MDYTKEIESLSAPGTDYEVDFSATLNKTIKFTQDNLGTLWIINIVYFFVTLLCAMTLIGIIALPALQFGYAIITRKLMKGEPIEVGDLFKGFDYFAPTLKTFIVQMALVFVLILPILILAGALFAMSSGQGLDDEFAGVFFIFIMIYYLFLIVAMYAFQVFFGNTYYFNVFSKLGTVNSFKKNYSFAKKRFWHWLLLYLIGGVITSFAIYLFLLGGHILEMMKAIAFFEIMDKEKGEEDELLQRLDSTL